MTVQDSILLGNANAPLSKTQIQNLPTILDIMEYVSKYENDESIKRLEVFIDWLRMNRNGYYCRVSETSNTNNAKLLPLSQTPFVFMRGQNCYCNPCKPSLYRMNNVNLDDFETIQRVKAAEFLIVCESHPVITELQYLCKIEGVAIAQHYGFLTECLDITNSKWVAAFFATTLYDKETDTYTPIKAGYGDGYGVFYISRFNDIGVSFSLAATLDALGFQYFARPSSQNSFVYRMKRDENFNDNNAFNKIYFRHDTAASELVYEYSFRQRRFYPNDNLSEIAKEICNPEYKISNTALTRCKTLGANQSESEIKRILQKHHISLSGNDSTLAHIPKEVIDKEWKEWNEYGRENLYRHILPVPPMKAI